jgi:FtsH-binding integral membrane protein
MLVFADECTYGESTLLRVGIGVGAPLAVLAMGFLVYWVRRESEPEERTRLWIIFWAATIAAALIVGPQLKSFHKHGSSDVTAITISLLAAPVIGIVIAQLPPKIDDGRALLMGVLGNVAILGTLVLLFLWSIAVFQPCFS